MRITHIFETHVQADHLSGARRLSEATGAPVIFHKSAPVAFPHVDVGEGERHELGNVSLSILHTPGHTPDSVSILVTDKTRAAEPWFVLTGDTLFSGGVGRPDLICAGSEAMLAEQLHDSLHSKIMTLPYHLEIFPAHFAGAACGKCLTGKPCSTTGCVRTCNLECNAASRAECVAILFSD